VEPTLKLNFLSHGTLECRDLAFTRRFYQEFLGFEVVQTSKISIWCRLGGQHIYVCVQSAEKAEMGFLGHNGIDVSSDAEVDKCYDLVRRDAETWRLKKISKPTVQHGAYSFYFWDADDNAWEILSNPPGGYSWMFERGDQTGMGHLKKSFARPDLAEAGAPAQGGDEGQG
jgi:catechol 2,3-dioxygenase-like lactoylglutathione lyase family enzyme